MQQVEGLRVELIGIRGELREERAAHRESRAQLARALNVAQQYQMRADELACRVDEMAKASIHAQTPGIPEASAACPCTGENHGARADGGDGGDESGDRSDAVGELLLATLGCLGRIGEVHLRHDPPPTRGELEPLLWVARSRLAMVTELLLGGEGPGTPQGGGGGGTPRAQDAKGGTQRQNA